VSDPKNKWNQPAAPPPPLFLGKKERDLVKQVNDELAERVVGQTIAYYPISIEDSNFNETYGEAIEKVSLPPVRVHAYVIVENEQTNDRYGYEYQSKLTVNFHRKRLTADQNLYVRVGDFIQYGEIFYEIVKTYNDTRYYFGQVEHKFQISADCVRARQGVFRVMPSIDRPGEVTRDTSEAASPEPRAAPYPPAGASYVTVNAERKLPNERVLTAGTGITLTDGGAGADLTIASTAQNAAGTTGSIQFGVGAGTFGGNTSLTYLTASNIIRFTGTLNLQGDITASSAVSASIFYGDGSELDGISGSPAGSTTEIQYNSAGSFAGSSNLTFNGTTLTGSYTGSLAQFSVLSASLLSLGATSGSLAGTGSYLGLDSSNNLILTSAASAPGGSNQQVQFNSSGLFGGSSNLTFNGTTLTGSYTGSLAQFSVLSASLLSLGATSGSLAGTGSYLGLDSSNNLVLTSAASTATSPAGATTQVQYNDGGSFQGSSNLTFNGTTLTGSFTGSLAEYTALTSAEITAINITASGDIVLDEDQRIYFEADKGTWIETDSVDRLRFVVGSNQMLLLDEDDNRVNIGYGNKLGVGLKNNTAPSALLHVSSSGDEALFRVDGATAGNVLFVTGSKRVGIGTATPSSTLHVAGDVTATSTVTGAAGQFTDITGTSLNVQAGGITNAGSIAGATTITGSGALSVGAGITLAGVLNVQSGSIVNAGVIEATSLTSSGAVTVDSVTVGQGYSISSAGAGVLASLNNSSGGITNAGSIAGATTIAMGGALTGATTITGSGALSIGAGATFAGAVNLQSGGLTNAGVIAGTTLLTASTGLSGTTVYANKFYGDGAGITGISSDAVDVTASTSNVTYGLVFTQGAQIDGSLGLAIQLTGATFNPATAELSGSGALSVGGGATLAGALDMQMAGITNAGHITGARAVSGSGLFSAAGGIDVAETFTVGASGRVRTSNTISGSGALSSGAGATLAGALNMQLAGITNAGAIAGATTVSASVGLSGSALYASDAYLDAVVLQALSGSLAGTGSYLGLDASNNLVLTSAASTTTATPGGSTTQIQYNSGGSLAGSSNLTFNGTTLTGSYTGSLAELTTISSSVLSVTRQSYLSGGITHKRTAISTHYTASATDYIIGITSTPLSIEFNASVFNDGQVVVVKDESGTASPTAVIAISGASTQTVDGDNNVAINSPYGSVLLYCNGTNWFIY